MTQLRHDYCSAAETLQMRPFENSDATLKLIADAIGRLTANKEGSQLLANGRFGDKLALAMR